MFVLRETATASRAQNCKKNWKHFCCNLIFTLNENSTNKKTEAQFLVKTFWWNRTKSDNNLLNVCFNNVERRLMFAHTFWKSSIYSSTLTLTKLFPVFIFGFRRKFQLWVELQFWNQTKSHKVQWKIWSFEEINWKLWKLFNHRQSGAVNHLTKMLTSSETTTELLSTRCDKNDRKEERKS